MSASPHTILVAMQLKLLLMVLFWLMLFRLNFTQYPKCLNNLILYFFCCCCFYYFITLATLGDFFTYKNTQKMIAVSF